MAYFSLQLLLLYSFFLTALLPDYKYMHTHMWLGASCSVLGASYRYITGLLKNPNLARYKQIFFLCTACSRLIKSPFLIPYIGRIHNLPIILCIKCSSNIQRQSHTGFRKSAPPLCCPELWLRGHGGKRGLGLVLISSPFFFYSAISSDVWSQWGKHNFLTSSWIIVLPCWLLLADSVGTNIPHHLLEDI